MRPDHLIVEQCFDGDNGNDLTLVSDVPPPYQPTTAKFRTRGLSLRASILSHAGGCHKWSDCPLVQTMVDAQTAPFPLMTCVLPHLISFHVCYPFQSPTPFCMHP